MILRDELHHLEAQERILHLVQQQSNAAKLSHELKKTTIVETVIIGNEVV